MIQAKRFLVKCGDWFTGIYELWNRVFSLSVSLSNEKNCRKNNRDEIAVCEKTAGLRNGKFSDLNSAC